MSMTRRRLLDDTYKQTAIGNPIQVRSVARMRPEITMQGWTEQEKTTGAQLLDMDDFETGASSGTTSYAWLKFQYHLTEGETYTVTNNGSTPITFKISYGQGGYSSVSKSNLTGSYSFTMTTHPNTPEGSELAVFIWAANISDPDELIKMIQESNLMLNKGDTALPYEPYTGGAPSPSPDYPQEIVSAGRWKEDTQKYEYEVNVTGANLLDDSQMKAVDVNLPENTRNGFEISLAPGQYTISKRRRHAYCFDAQNHAIEVSKNLFDEYGFMLNEGSTALPYEPYKSQTVTLTSDRPLTEWDKLEKRNSVWGWVYGSGTLVIPKTGYGLRSRGGTDGIYFYKQIPNSNVIYLRNGDTFREYQYFNYFTCDNPFNIIGDYMWIYRSLNEPEHAEIRVGLSDLDVTTVEQFENILAGMEDIKAVYKTEEETFVSLSSSEQEALNALHTNNPTTVLSNDQGCEMSLIYKTRRFGNLIKLDKTTLQYCTFLSQSQIKSNIVNTYFCSIFIYYLNDFILNNKGKELILSCNGTPTGRYTAIVVYGTFDDGETYKEKNMPGNQVSMVIPENATSITRLELRVNRQSVAFTDKETIISNLHLKLN